MNDILNFLVINGPAIWFATGLLGSGLEAFGEKFGHPKLVAIGQRLEAASIDLPKLIRGSRFTKEQGK
jgi:hypothetical protein